MPPRAASAEQTPAQNVEQIAAALEEFLAEHARAVVLEDGKMLFDMRQAKYKLATEHGRCTLHLWGEERNLVRRVSGDNAERRAAVEYASLRADKAADFGISGRPRSAHTVHARGYAGEVSARTGTG